MTSLNPARFSVMVLVPGEPVGKGRPKASTAGGFVRMYTPAKTADYEEEIRAQSLMSVGGVELFEAVRITKRQTKAKDLAKAYLAHGGVAPIASPCQLELSVVCAIPASYSKQKRAKCLSGEIAPTKKPDIDNVLKAVCDAFNGIVWTDDVLCTRVIVEKTFGETPHVQATVTLLDKLCV